MPVMKTKNITLSLLFLTVSGILAAQTGPANPSVLNPNQWRVINRGDVDWQGKSVFIKDCFLAGIEEHSSKYAMSFRAKAPKSEDQVQIWSGFGFQNRNQRYSLGLRGGNSNDLYLYRHQTGAGAKMLAIESLDFEPKPGEWFDIKVIFIEGHIQVFVNNEDTARIVVTDKDYLPGGSAVLGGGWIPTEYSDVEIRQLTDREAKRYLKKTEKYSTAATAKEKEALRKKQRNAYEPLVIERLNEDRTEISLAGDWLFMPEYAMKGRQKPYAEDFDDRRWHIMLVPAFWNTARNWLHLQDSKFPHRGSGISDNYREKEQARCDAYTFDSDKTAAAWYRHRIKLPKDIAGKRFFLHFDAVSKVADIYVNGNYVGGHVGMFGEFGLDITGHVKPGENVIAVNVKVRKFEKVAQADKNVARAVSVDINNDMLNSLPCGMFRGDEGGIWQPVKLVITEPVHISDIFANTRTDGAAVEIELENTNSKTAMVEIKIAIADATNGSMLYTSTTKQKATVAGGESTKVTVDTGKLSPKLWRPKTPNLYQLTCSIFQNGKRIDTTETTIGFRTFSVSGNQFLLNGVPYYICGANHPPCGIAPNDTQLANRFFQLMHDGNQMVTRSHGCPFTEAWMDAADKQGVGVSYEGSWPWMMISNVPSQELLDIWKDEMLSLVRKYRNHPSLLIWTINNEMYFPMFQHSAPQEVRLKKLKFLSDTIQEIRKLSPGIPVSCDSGYSRVQADYEQNFKPHGIDDGEIDDRHVYFNWYNRDFFQVFYGEWAKRIYWSPGANPGRAFFSQEASTGYTNNDTGHYNRKYLFNNYVPQAWVGDWAYEDRDPAYSLNRHAFMTKELAETIRRTSPETAGVLLFANVCWFRNVFEANQIEPYPVYDAVRLAHQPVLVSAELFGRSFYAGATISPRVCIVNNGLTGKEIPPAAVKWQIVADGKTLAKGSQQTPAVPFYDRAWLNLNIPLSKTLPAAKTPCQLQLSLKSGNTALSENEYDVLLAEKRWVQPEVTADKTIGVFDLTGKTCSVLDFMGVDYVTLKDLTEIRTRKLDLLIAANLDANGEVPYNWEDVRNVAKDRGMNVILVHPGKHMQWLFYDKIASIYERTGRVVNMHRPEHPTFDEIDPMELAWWHQPDRKRPRACKRSYRLKESGQMESLCTYLRPHTGLPGDRAETYYEMSGTPLLKVQEGRGIVIGSEMETNQGINDPVAARLLRNLIETLTANDD